MKNQNNSQTRSSVLPAQKAPAATASLGSTAEVSTLELVSSSRSSDAPTLQLPAPVAAPAPRSNPSNVVLLAGMGMSVVVGAGLFIAGGAIAFQPHASEDDFNTGLAMGISGFGAAGAIFAVTVGLIRCVGDSEREHAGTSAV